jgi:ectoine hydroxylase-related dioxygenase (phytanoyl-CoA dioxygenase family)
MATATLDRPSEPAASDIANLPDLSSDYPLTQEQIDAFQRDGHILLRGVLSPEEVRAYRPVITAAVERLNWRTDKLEDRDTYGKAFIQVGHLWGRDAGSELFTTARRFGKIAAELMGVPTARLYHDQALYKEAGGGHTPWHQDQFYWPIDSDKTITMWMPLVDVPIARGALTFASGSHKKGYIKEIAISDESEEFYTNYVKEEGFPIAVEPMAAGDCTFHTGWTLHTAPGNNTDTMREVMTVIYYADGVLVLEPDHPMREHDLKGCFPGLKGGDVAATHMNPIVYSAK